MKWIHGTQTYIYCSIHVYMNPVLAYIVDSDMFYTCAPERSHLGRHPAGRTSLDTSEQRLQTLEGKPRCVGRQWRLADEVLGPACPKDFLYLTVQTVSAYAPTVNGAVSRLLCAYEHAPAGFTSVWA
jgi:hypothetical protein